MFIVRRSLFLWVAPADATEVEGRWPVHTTDLIGLMIVMMCMTTAWGPRSEAATGAIAVNVQGELEEPGCDSSSSKEDSNPQAERTKDSCGRYGGLSPNGTCVSTSSLWLL